MSETGPLIEVGHKFLEWRDLSDEQKAILRSNFVRHVTYSLRRWERKTRQYFPVEIRASLFRDCEAVQKVIGIPAEGESDGGV